MIIPLLQLILKLMINISRLLILKTILRNLNWQKEDNDHYYVAFKGPKGYFNLQLPKMTTFLLPGEATVETLSTEIIKLLAPKMPPNVEALGVYVYEGVNKGAHIIAEIRKR